MSRAFAKLNPMPALSVLGSSASTTGELTSEKLHAEFAVQLDPPPPVLGRKALRRAFYKAAEKLKVELNKWDEDDECK